MKKLISGIFIGIAFTALVGAGIENYVVNKRSAEVNNRMGLLVFTDCTPLVEYEYLGTVKYKLTFSGQYHEIIPALLKQAKKNFPNADAIIYVSGEQADCIRFK